jgi:ABC-type Mn2+/Zn2+ transport system ATPase subunit
VFNALDYLLGVNKLPATILQSRKIINPDGNPIRVQGSFKWDGIPVAVMRTVGNFEIKIGDEIFKKGKAEEKLDEIMGMPRDLFRKIIHKRQKEGGFFLDFTAGEMHDFLMDCTGLTPFKAKYAIIESKLSQLESYALVEQQTLDRSRTSLSVTQDAILALGLAPVQDMHKEVILELKEKSNRSAAEFVGVRTRHESVVQEYVRNRPDTTNPQYDASIREDLERRRKEIEAKISTSLENERKRQDGYRRQINEKSLKRGPIVSRIDRGAGAKTSAAEIAAEIKSIKEATCPTCTQEWKTEGSVEAIKTRFAKLDALRLIVIDAEKASVENTTLDQELGCLNEQLKPEIDPNLPVLNEELAKITQSILDDKRKAQEMYDQQNTETKAKLDAFVAGQSELQKKCDLELDQARGQMDLDRRVLDSAVQKLRSYEIAKEQYEQTYNKLKKQESLHEKQSIDCNLNLENTIKEQKRALETQKALLSYISCSFDEALDAIGSKATKIIRCIPNTKNATIQFEGIKETQKGTIKEEVNAVISVDGETGVPIKSFSGGERSSIDLAVDLAVIDYIETRTGKGMNIFILDEPFSGLGTVEIEMALEVLKNSQIGKKLIIVEHNPEVKEMVQSRVIVVRDGLISRIA